MNTFIPRKMQIPDWRKLDKNRLLCGSLSIPLSLSQILTCQARGHACQMTDRCMRNNVLQFPKRIVSPAETELSHRMKCDLAAIAFISIVVLASCWIIDSLLGIPSGPTGRFRFDFSACELQREWRFSWWRLLLICRLGIG